MEIWADCSFVFNTICMVLILICWDSLSGTTCMNATFVFPQKPHVSHLKVSCFQRVALLQGVTQSAFRLLSLPASTGHVMHDYRRSTCPASGGIVGGIYLHRRRDTNRCSQDYLKLKGDWLIRDLRRADTVGVSADTEWEVLILPSLLMSASHHVFIVSFGKMSHVMDAKSFSWRENPS